MRRPDAPARTPTPSRGPAELVLAAAAARRYYLDRRSQVEIAEELGVSRFKVARLLNWARAAGVVRIEVVLPADIDGELSDRVRAAFGLHHAVVVATAERDAVSLRDVVGQVSAELLTELTVPDDVVGLAWGRLLRSMTRGLSSLPPCTLVQLTGALPHPDVDANAVELVRRAASLTGGRAVTFYAPLFVPDPATAEVLRGEPGIREALAALDHLTKAVVSIGAWRDNDSTVHDALDPVERAQLAGRGVRAETAGILLAADGVVLDALADRVVGVTTDQLRRTPEVIALAYGDGRAAAAHSVLRSGLVSSFVTHASLARRILDLAEERPRSADTGS